MKLILQSPKKALKAFLKQRPKESERDKFKANFIALLNKISIIEKQTKDESEEHLKNNIRDFLRDTFYIDSHAINTKDKKDLVIHIGKSTDTNVAVIIEAKRPSNTKEMISTDNANKKALHELILYYLNERIQSKNIQLKHLVITNIYEWFIIDANQFDKYIYRNTQIKKLYETKLNDKKDNPWFYEEISKIISTLKVDIDCIYFDIRDYEKILRNKNNITEDDKELVALYKILSPQHLLKIASPNDSNALNERFYKELLHIIGLEEAREGTKNVIRRKKENRNNASLIELTIDALKTEDIFHRIPDIKIYGENKEEQTFNIALELCITWINRILFLKLLESQLVSYHQGNKNYRFLNSETIHDFDELFKLFHKVLAVNIPSRTEAIKQKYSRVPYLNSSLFEISELEDQTIKINSLENDGQLELFSTTVLKDIKKNTDKLPTLDYLFRFLDAYDFSSEGTEDWQKDNKQLINASVLGKVFEKINGYRDGSIFTPAFITMYMCRQSIRLAVVEKFNEVLAGKDKKLFDKFEDVKNYTSKHFKTEDVLKANEIVNSIRICDPAVGSGHFLVSALNEIIAIKSELGILADEKGNIVSGYEIEIVNDELIITDKQGNLVEYKIQNGKPVSKDIQRLQKILFHEKQTIIENCLFGVDINPKSVLICRLRLWIELLKNAYYKEPDYTELETLPNIDINIKCGNSLIQRFSLNDRNSDYPPTVQQKLRLITSKYKEQIIIYKSTNDRQTKKNAEKNIKEIKETYASIANPNDPDYKKIKELEAQLGQMPLLFSSEDKEQWVQKTKKLNEELNIAKQNYDLKLKTIYNNAFEWRFEFPEVLDDNGNFVGFDLIIGNPPYIKEYENRDAFNGLRNLECYQGKMDIWYLFGDLGLKILKPNYYLCYIATNNWVTNAGASKFRNIVIRNSQIVNLIDFGAYMIFENASIQTMIMLFKNSKTADNYTFDYRKLEGNNLELQDVLNLLEAKETEKTVLLSPMITKANLIDKPLTFNKDENSVLLDKIKVKQNFFIDSKKEIAQGIVPNPDVVNNNNILKLPSERIKKENIKVGDGVFIVKKGFFQKLSEKESRYIKPVYEPHLVDKYILNDFEKEIIYITKKNYRNDAPKLISHLEKFKEIMEERRENQQGKLSFFHLHWPRDEYFFEKGEKILIVRKCTVPTFVYTEEEAYVMLSFNVIRSKRINLKYLTGLLNSKLIAFWLRKKGKMQGNNYQLDKEPLLEIPIYKPDDKDANEIANLVDIIISLKKQGKDSSEYERKIDELVYKLYDITPEEQKIIEGK